MKDIKLQIARRIARKNVLNSKRNKGFISGEQSQKIQLAIKNSI